MFAPISAKAGENSPRFVMLPGIEDTGYSLGQFIVALPAHMETVIEEPVDAGNSVDVDIGEVIQRLTHADDEIVIALPKVLLVGIVLKLAGVFHQHDYLCTRLGPGRKLVERESNDFLPLLVRRRDEVE